MVSESKLTLDILPLSADTARLVRVYGTAPCVVLPAVLPAPEGGSFAVTELGGYCFSEKPRSLPAADKPRYWFYRGASFHQCLLPLKNRLSSHLHK